LFVLFVLFVIVRSPGPCVPWWRAWYRRKALGKEGYMGFVSWHLNLQWKSYEFSKLLWIRKLLLLTICLWQWHTGTLVFLWSMHSMYLETNNFNIFCSHNLILKFGDLNLSFRPKHGHNGFFTRRRLTLLHKTSVNGTLAQLCKPHGLDPWRFLTMFTTTLPNYLF